MADTFASDLFKEPAMIRAAALALCLSAATSPALAQAPQGGAAEGRNTNFVSFGAAMLPDYSGSDDYRVIPFGAFRYELDGVTLRSDGPGLAADLIKRGPVTAGVYARWSGGRDEVEDSVVALLPDVDSSIITGAFVDVQIAENIFTGFDRVSLGARAGIDALGAFEGVAWSTSASYFTALSRTSFLGLSASVSGYSDDYAETLFSVDAPGAVASGLPVYTAQGGLHDVGLTALLTVGVSANWSVTSVVGVSRLLGDFADSPLVSVRGDENQAFVGVALGRSF
jgi:outer membrane protein